LESGWGGKLPFLRRTLRGPVQFEAGKLGREAKSGGYGVKINLSRANKP